MKDCKICLEKLNANSCKFCCGEYHKDCILQAIKVTGKCPICRFDFKLYKDFIAEDTYNFDQVQHIVISNLKEKIDILHANLHNVISDFGTRLSALEMYAGNGNNSIINNHSIRINRIEQELNNIT